MLADPMSSDHVVARVLRLTVQTSIWSVGPAFSAPLLDFGRLDAIVERADYRSRELLFAYKQTVLSAVRDVDTAADAYTAQQTRLKHLADALAAARRAVTLATERFDRGLTDSLNVIDAQRLWPLDCSFLLDPLIKLSRPRRAHAVITATLVVSAFYL
jgi:outer membrane protein TolC